VRRALASAIAAALLALLAVAAAPGGAGATPIPGPGEAIQCAPGERWCIAVFNSGGRRTLAIYGWVVRGRYRVCVTPPRSRRERCKSFTLVVNGHGGAESRVRLARHFPHGRHGTYRARWIYQGKQLGRTLSFPYPGLR
jgi:hypothetical protein